MAHNIFTYGYMGIYVQAKIDDSKKEEGDSMRDEAWELDAQVINSLHKIVNEIDRRSAKGVGRFGLTLGQYGVLYALYRFGDLSVGAAQRIILSTTGTIPLIVRNLETRGLVERYTDADDRRRSLMHLTKAGESLVAAAYPKVRKITEDTLSTWDAEEKNMITALANRMEEAQTPAEDVANGAVTEKGTGKAKRKSAKKTDDAAVDAKDKN